MDLYRHLIHLSKYISLLDLYLVNGHEKVKIKLKQIFLISYFFYRLFLEYV